MLLSDQQGVQAQRYDDNLDTCPHTTDNEDEVGEDEEIPELELTGGTNTPSTTLKRAKQSFLMKQNTVLKEYEEVRLYLC